MNALSDRNQQPGQTNIQPMHTERLNRLWQSACRLHAGPLLLDRIAGCNIDLEERPLDYWQREVDRLLLTWITGKYSHAEAVERIACLKMQLHESISQDSTSSRSIDAMLCASWDLVNSAHYDEKNSAKEEVEKPILRIVREIP